MTRARVALLMCSAILLTICAHLITRDLPKDFTNRSRVTISLGGRGFTPRTVYVTKGTIVTFKSERDGQFWPASDLHPFHSIFPDFDPKRPLEQNESWEFVFEKEGFWSYHDHIDPTFTGTIIVVSPGERGEKTDATPECDQSDLGARRACWKLRILLALKRDGLEAAFDEVKTVYESHSEFADDCHFYVHDLGLLAYGEYGKRIPLTDKMATCGQGFWHGYMEGYLAKDGDVDSAAAFCERTGASLKKEFPLSGPQCYHGIGHGQMEFLLSTRPDLMNDLVGLVNLGISSCTALPNDDARFRCASGVYAVTKDWVNLQRLEDEYEAYFSL